MLHHITVLPGKQNIEAEAGRDLLSVLRTAGLVPDAPCGGNGACGKCKVCIDGREVLACQTILRRDLTVTLPAAAEEHILTDGIDSHKDIDPVRDGYLLAFDIGTTTVVGYLLDGKTGEELAVESARNPQAVFGADVISRIQHALRGNMDTLTGCIRQRIHSMTTVLCTQAGISPDQIGVVSIVGNPAMQQLFLGLLPDNLATIPFAPILTEAKVADAKPYIPSCENAHLLIIPDISGYVGADTLACVLAAKLDEADEITLLVDIGTNGEMVLGNKHRMVACSTAAGPALEGANIQCGMRATEGAIDHVWLEDDQLQHSVIGGGEAKGICGSGLIDTVAASLDAGWINSRGRIGNPQQTIPLTPSVQLTQEDIRQVQMAKGAIAAGITLMAAHLGITLEDIDRVYLAGAFGTYMNPDAACRIGLLPAALKGKIVPIGNAAGSGAKLLAQNKASLAHVQRLVSQIEFIELASAPTFRRCFAKNMEF